MRALILCAVVLAMACPGWSQCSVTLGDGSSLSAAQFAMFLGMLGPDDTICIAPGEYQLSTASGWPVVIPADGPGIVGADGAEATVLIGDGSMTAFLLADGALGRFSGLTFRSFGEPIYLDDLGGETFLEFTDNVVEYGERGLRLLQHDAVVSRNIFRHNTIYGVNCTGVNVTLEDNEICYNGYGIVIAYIHSFRRNHVYQNDDFGLSSSLGGPGVIEDNLFEDNGGTGLVISSGGASDVARNVFRGNAVGVQHYVMGAGRGVLYRSNDLYGNTGYDFECVAPGAPSTIDLTLNWWGTTDPAEIAEHIFDCDDDPAVLYCVSYDPWCYAPGCEGASPSEDGSWGRVKALYR